MVGSLDHAKSAKDMSVAAWRLHALSGKYRGFWSVTVNGNWRLIFRFDGTDAVLVDYLDYHGEALYDSNVQPTAPR